MFAMFDEVPSSTSLLMQCGYRSKVCTNPRATKIDGTLHKLCEFHRRKANANQQRLHKRQREERVLRRQAEATADIHPVKKTCLQIQVPSDPLPIEPIRYAPVDFGDEISLNDFFAGKFTPSDLTPEDIDMLEVLLLDVHPLVLSPTPSSPTAVDDGSIVI
ncbi:unnamed protein product [Phytophthora lilii]|uniref:Unnamed protein product n=1 Tax=Phytophthora lilii TaxID=2077276 RepID=A0A9W6U0W9_9STRA|nr:unnamed protein product [Phytophthora lilii]